MEDFTKKPRWHYRFDNYKRAFYLLSDAIEQKNTRELNQLECEGIIQRFEYTWELAWKTLKDYLENDGIVLEKITPKEVIITAIEAKIITDRQKWMNALDDRNAMSHTYSNKVFEQIIDNIAKDYLEILNNLFEKLLGELIDE